MGILSNISIIIYCYFINIHYGTYGIIKSDLFRYPIETVNSEIGAKKKRGVKFGSHKKNYKILNKKKLDKNNSTKQPVLYLQTVQ